MMSLELNAKESNQTTDVCDIIRKDYTYVLDYNT